MMGPLGDAARGPVSSYADAKAWLFTYSAVGEWLFDPEAELPREAKLVCDMFWVREADLVRDLRKLWNDAPPPAPYAPIRRTRSGGWR